MEPPTGAVVASGAVGALAQLLNHGASGDDVQLEALRCLTNVAADDSAHARTVRAWNSHDESLTNTEVFAVSLLSLTFSCGHCQSHTQTLRWPSSRLNFSIIFCLFHPHLA